jgi:hypothetical protein
LLNFCCSSYFFSSVPVIIFFTVYTIISLRRLILRLRLRLRLSIRLRSRLMSTIWLRLRSLLMSGLRSRQRLSLKFALKKFFFKLASVTTESTRRMLLTQKWNFQKMYSFTLIFLHCMTFHRSTCI